MRKRSKFVRKKGTKRLKKALRVQNVPRKVLLPTDKRIGVVLSVQNEAQTLPLVLRELSRLPLHELIIIVNGSTDASLSLARNVPGATVVHYQEPVGHDVGRAIGAKLATSDILVFVDADFIIPAERLVPFVTAVDRGMDVALNNISPYLKPSRSLDRVTYLKEFLNRILGRPDLRANSLTAVPHAISRKALDMIGCHQLMVPPKAQASAIIKGLVVGAPGSVEVLKANRHKAGNVGRMNMVSELIAGDHLEALQFAMDELGGRLWFSDHGRRRDLLGGA
ncbi:hypothetical protein J2TS4_05030 [Paenibacillus sp. J2TS4]|nr:hypothetical protein J2TS4_05030 [Paenibacillus sp. J2TS4]